MTKRLFLCVLALAAFSGCKRGSPLSKIIDGAPLGGNSLSALPVNALQAFHILQRDVIGTVVGTARRAGAATPTYPELDLTGAPNYTFTANGRYGVAAVSFKFQDGSNGDLDPFVSAPSSTSTIKFIVFNNINVTGFPFNGSITSAMTITLATTGDLNSQMRLTGAYTMTATTYTVVFTFPAPGAVATFTGCSGGELDITGAGPGGAIGGTVIFDTEREVNGTITWDGFSGEVHVADNGDGLLLLNNIRYFFD